MKIIGFNYLQRQHFVTLMIILFLASALFSITALGFFGVYKSFNAYLGEEENIIAIYDKKSRTPFTGLVPTYLAERISSVEGVLASSPEVVIPCIVKGKSVFLRGVVPDDLYRLNPLAILNGIPLQLNDTNFAMVGKSLGKELSLTTSDKILVVGALSRQFIELEIKGVYESNTALDEEIIAPLYVGQWLRGTDYGLVTIIRAKIDRSKISPAQIYQIVAQEAETPTPQPPPNHETKPSPLEEMVPISRIPLSPENLGVKETQEFMKTYLNRYGMTPETLLILSTAVFFFASATIFTSSYALIRQHKPEITVLRSLGASVKTLKLDLVIKVLPLSLVASFVGVIIAMLALSAIQELGQPQILSHRVRFQPDLLLITVNITLAVLIVVLAIIRSTKRLDSS